MGMVWSSDTIKHVHRAVERDMQTKMLFKLSGERHEDMWIDGVQLNVKELLIYLIKHFGLEEKAWASGCDIAITVNGAKLNDYCTNVTCGFKMTDKEARDPLDIDEDEPLKRGKLLLSTIQSIKNDFPITSLIAKDNKSTYNKFLRHIFEFGQELRDVRIPDLGWKPFRVSEPQDMKSIQLCMHRGGAAKQISYVCHLCKKHSYGISHLNQMACGKCASEVIGKERDA
jgi:DNA-directed RNA polymerase subunit RPC12/RpoP